MIHYVVVGVAMSRPPKTDEYRRYAIYGGTHQEAELVALQMAACTSVMPVETVREPSGRPGVLCAAAGCRVAQQEPHGTLGCTCWHITWDDDLDGDTEAWQVSSSCPLHSEDDAAWVALAEEAERIRERCEPSGPWNLECPVDGCRWGRTGGYGDGMAMLRHHYATEHDGGVATCTRPAPHECRVNGPCNGLPKTEEGAPQCQDSASPPTERFSQPRNLALRLLDRLARLLP